MLTLSVIKERQIDRARGCPQRRGLSRGGRIGRGSCCLAWCHGATSTDAVRLSLEKLSAAWLSPDTSAATATFDDASRTFERMARGSRRDGLVTSATG